MLWLMDEKPVKSILITYDNIRNNATGQGDDYATGYVLDYTFFTIALTITRKW